MFLNESIKCEKEEYGVRMDQLTAEIESLKKIVSEVLLMDRKHTS